MKRSLWFAVCIYLAAFSTGVSLFSEAAQGANENAGQVYGIIAMGASGIEGFVVGTGAADPENPAAKILKRYEPAPETEWVWDAAIACRAGPLAEQMRREMQADYNLLIGHLYAVASSEAPAKGRRSLSETILHRVRAKLEFITVERQIALEFRGILPPARFGQALLIDIGADTTSGAWQASPGNTGFKTFALPLGTKTFANQISQKQGDGLYDLAADSVSNEELLPAVKQVIQQNPNIASLHRVYLAGEITWAMCTLLRPYEQGAWVKISASDIDTFFEKARTDPNALLHPDLEQVPRTVQSKDLEAAKQNAQASVAKVNAEFSKEQLAAGAQILKTLKDSMSFDRREAILFPGERALYALPLGYVLDQITP